jgi:hypothetical protein
MPRPCVGGQLWCGDERPREGSCVNDRAGAYVKERAGAYVKNRAGAYVKDSAGAYVSDDSVESNNRSSRDDY